MLIKSVEKFTVNALINASALTKQIRDKCWSLKVFPEHNKFGGGNGRVEEEEMTEEGQALGTLWLMLLFLQPVIM